MKESYPTLRRHVEGVEVVVGGVVKKNFGSGAGAAGVDRRLDVHLQRVFHRLHFGFQVGGAL